MHPGDTSGVHPSGSMRFAVKRTSEHNDDVAPCPGAVKGTLPYWDVRTFKSFEEYDAKLGRLPGGRWR